MSRWEEKMRTRLTGRWEEEMKIGLKSRIKEEMRMGEIVDHKKWLWQKSD